MEDIKALVIFVSFISLLIVVAFDLFLPKVYNFQVILCLDIFAKSFISLVNFLCDLSSFFLDVFLSEWYSSHHVVEENKLDVIVLVEPVVEKFLGLFNFWAEIFFLFQGKVQVDIWSLKFHELK